ncbi:helix-turn-helix domain-containing protein [Aeoliella sp. SH292]|uniref:helix-turn-helix domain-containing protein n=1 Tax=Aeoliella sp. SH292 TaxID=3454464 RepID=UPI003F9498A2
MAATALFISSSDALRDEVAAHVSRWQDVFFAISTHLNEAILASHPSLAIVYFHADVATSVDWKQLLTLAEDHESQPAVVAVMDAFDPAGAVSLLQLGVTDCLPTPIDFSRMAMQIGYESWRAYHAPRPSRVSRERASELSLANFGPVSLAATLPVPFELESSRRSAELAAISQALAAHNNNRSKAAAALGVSRVTLYKKLHKYGMMGLAQDAG